MGARRRAGDIGTMRIGLLAPAFSALVLLAGASAASPASGPATCTSAQKAQRQAALTAFQKRMPAAKKAYFAHHRSARLRKAWVARQQARLKALTQAASCTAPASTNPDAARMEVLVKYADDVEALSGLFDPPTNDDADAAIATLAMDEQDCADDPTLDTCPLDNSEYTDTATAVNAAAKPLSQLATKLAAITPPAMAVGDYEDSASDCGADLVTVAAAHKALRDANGTWADTLTAWGKAYGGGKSPDYAGANYEPGVDTIDSAPHQALVDWAVMVRFYWDALAGKVASPPDVPQWLGDLADEECPSS
jgi:hypothetical protein